MVRFEAEQIDKRTLGPLERLHGTGAGCQKGWQVALPFFKQTIAVGLRDHQDVCICRFVCVYRAQQLKAGAWVARGRTHAAQSSEIYLDVRCRGLVGQDDRGLRQIGQTRERETAVGIGRKVGHGQVVAKACQVDGGLRVDSGKQLGRRRGLAAAQVVGRDLKGKLQLVVSADHERGNFEVRTGLGVAVIKQRQHHRTFAAGPIVPGLQRVRLDELIVDRDVQRAVVRHAVWGVTVGQVQWHTLCIPGEQVGGHAGVDVHRVIEHRTAQL